MRISKLWPGFAIGLTLLVAACGGGGSSSPAPTTAPTTAPTATPSPGPLLVGYTLSNGGATVAPTAAPSAAAFVAVSQTAAVTVSQTNFSGSYAASTNTACGTNVTVSPATSTTGSFTVTAANVVAAAAGCQVTFTGATGSTVALSASVPAPGGVVLQWVANAALAAQAPPVTPIPGPINLIGVTSTFGAVLVASETHYFGKFNTPTLSAQCGTNLSAPVTSTNANVGNITQPSAALGQSQAYFDVSAPAAAAAFAQAAGCTIKVTDQITGSVPATIPVVLTTSSGVIQ